MSSIILTLCNMGKYLKNAYFHSWIYSILSTIFVFFSNGWNNSRIMTVLRKNDRVGMSAKSVFYNVAHFPFLLCEYLNEVLGEKLNKIIDASYFLRLARSMASSFLMLDSKVMGAFLLGWFASYELLFRDFTIYYCCVGVLGALMIIADSKYTYRIREWGVVKFVLKTVGLNCPKLNLSGKVVSDRRAVLVAAALFGVLAGALGVKLSVVLLFGFIGASLVLMYPLAGVFASVFAAPFVPTMVLAALCIFTFLALVIKSIIIKDFKWRFDGLGNALVVFLMFMFISCVLSFTPVKSLMVWAMYFVFVGFYFVIINLVKNKEQLVSVLKVFVIAGLIVSLYGVMQYAFGWTSSENAWIDTEMFEEAVARVDSTMENPNVLGEFLLLYLPLSAVFMLREKSGKLSKILYGGAFLVGLLCMVLTQSRGCWLGLILAIAVFISFYNGKLWGLLPLAFVALPFVMPETMIARFMSVGNMEDTSTSYRVYIWLGTFRMLKDFWLGGIGMGEGAFGSVYPLYSYSAIVAPHSHNTFLQLLVEGGIAALLIFIAIMAVFLKKLSVTFRETKKGGMINLLVLAIGSGVVGFLLQSMFDYTFYNYRMMAMFFMIIALGMSFRFIREVKDEKDN